MTPRDAEHDHGALQPDVVLPTQFFASIRGRLSGEQRLLIAILEDAVECFRKHALARGRRGQQLFREVEQWLMSDDEAPFTFAHICAMLDLDPAYLRGGLQRWHRHQSPPLEAPPGSVLRAERVGAGPTA